MTNPACKGIWVQNIGPSSVNIAAAISGNTISGADVYDCQDQTTGSLTAGTANSWTSNSGLLSSPAGLCFPASATTTSAATAAASPSAQLAFTGAPSQPLITTGVLALLAGFALQTIARRRRAASHRH